MEGRPTSFWGKFERNEDGAFRAWHPLIDHSADVSACCRHLLSVTILRKRLALLAGLEDFCDAQLDRLAFFAALHDIGKYNLGFQNIARPGAPFTAGHVREVLALFGSEYQEAARLGEALGVDAWLPWGEDDASFQLLIASIAHHGRPEPLGTGHQPRIWQESEGLSPFDGIRTLREAASRWFPAAFTDAPPFPASSSFYHAYSGLVMLADWLGSSTRWFPFAESLGKDRMPFAKEAAERALREIGLDPREARRALLREEAGFERWFGFSPRGAQEPLRELPVSSTQSLTVLEAETGAGKTEAALARFFTLFAAGEVDGLYFALPTRTAATQLHARVVRAVERAFPVEESRPPVTLAVPGYLRVDDRDGQRLPRFEVLWNDDPLERFRSRGWASENTKRYLAGAVVVGTVDQALLGTLTVSHAHLRNTSLLRHLLVVDEVHASDTYMNRILEALLRRHLAAGGHALLMSATLGAVTRARLSRPGLRQPAPALTEAIEVPYPALTHVVGPEQELYPITSPGNPKEVQVEPWVAIGAPAEIVGRALDAAAAGARVIVLRNTVADCVETQRVLEAEAEARGVDALLFRCEGAPAPHHARFAREDRVRLDVALETAFGRGGEAEGRVVVATQTIQQSLDLDADLLITDLCPIDVLLQRIGRLHRHSERERPSGFERATAVILVPAERDLGTLLRKGGEVRGRHGLGSVYDDLRILEATWRQLDGGATWLIPRDNRALVEHGTHPEILQAIVRDGGEAWQEHANLLDGLGFAAAAHASINLVQWTAGFDDSTVLFPQKGLERRIATRLGEDDRRALFDQPVPGPFGAMIPELTLPAHQAREAPADTIPTGVIFENCQLRFSFGVSLFSYDRFGLRALPAPEVHDANE